MPSRLTKTTSSPLGVTKRPASLLHGYIKLTLGDNRKIKYAARAQAKQQLLCRRRKKNEKALRRAFFCQNYDSDFINIVLLAAGNDLIHAY